MKFHLHIFFQLCRRLRAAFLNQVTRNRLCLSEQTYPGLLESGPDPRYVIRLQEARSSNPLNAGSTYYTQQFKVDRPAITQPQRLSDAFTLQDKLHYQHFCWAYWAAAWWQHYLVHGSIYFHRNDEICIVHRLLEETTEIILPNNITGY